MSYENLETQGTIKGVSSIKHLTTATEGKLVSPEEVYLTDVDLGRNLGPRPTELFGRFGEEYVGKLVHLIESYRLEDGLKKISQRVYIDGKLEVELAGV